MAGEKGAHKYKTGWKTYISLFLPIVILTGFAIVFSGSSSSSDCGDCSSSSADLSGVCGEAVKVDKSGTVRPVFSVTAKSGTTDLRCGFGVSWSYKWKSTTKKPPITIAVSAPKGGTSKANTSDTGGPDGYSGTYVIARGSVSGSSPVTGTITVTASTMDPATLLDPVTVNLHLVYSAVKASSSK